MNNLINPLLAESVKIDGGQCGSFTHYSLVIAFVGAAFIIFLYLWKKGKLDMDEEPKITMMHDEESHSHPDEDKDE